ncbi:hypothetical protein D3C84_750050 [compost metagenome]
MAFGQGLLHPALGSAVEVAEDLGMLEEVAVLEHVDELFAGHEVVIDAVHFPRAHAAGGVGDGYADVRLGVDQGLDQAGLAGAGGGGNDVQGAGGGGHGAVSYSMFWTCSRICSINTLRLTAAWVLRGSKALEPRVLASRLSSCIRKSRRRPAAPPALSTRRTSLM